MRKCKVAVLMGGKSPEHDVSLVTGKEVVDNLDRKKYEVMPVIISRDGKSWDIKTLKEFAKFNPKIGCRSPKWQIRKPKGKEFAIPIKIKPSPDVFFIAMHGPFGEDGTVQGMLDFLGVPYTGAGVLGSALGMNKIAFRRIIEHFGLPGPKWISFSKDERIPWQKINKFGPPWVVKPSSQGSSVGISIVSNKNRLQKGLKEAFTYDGEILVEEYISGVEVSCGVLGNKEPYPLPVIEICPKNKFFDYEAKYTAEMCEEVVPARLTKQLRERVQKLAVDVFKVVNCRGFGRVDMIIRNNKPYILEVNTIPGLTPVSLLPREAIAAGISYPKLLDLIIQYALE